MKWGHRSASSHDGQHYLKITSTELYRNREQIGSKCQHAALEWQVGFYTFVTMTP